MWVQLTSLQQLDLNGSKKNYYPGDWVDVGRQTALGWLSIGAARVFDLTRIDLGRNVGIVFASPAPAKQKLIEASKLKVAFGIGSKAALFEKTVLWDPHVNLRLDLLVAGIQFLEKWEVAIPLVDYDKTALDVGTPVEREVTQSVIHELRVPLYDPRLVFLRRTPAVEHFVTQWRGEQGEMHLALLRALYVSKLLLLPLPTIWTGVK